MSTNLLLRSLPAELQSLLLRQARPEPFRPKQILVQQGARILSVHFPVAGVFSLLNLLENGDMTEVGLIGSEGVIGPSAILMQARSSHQVMCQVQGLALNVPVEEFWRLMDEHPPIRRVAFNYLASLIDQLSFLSGCASLHELRGRLASWLLLIDDRTLGRNLRITHDLVALMLSVRRASVSELLEDFQRRGIVQLSRGQITLLDRQALEGAACPCYRSLRERH